MLNFLQDIAELLLGSKRQDALRHFALKKGFTYSRQMRHDSLPKEVKAMRWLSQQKIRAIRGFLYRTEDKWNATGYIIELLHQTSYGEKSTTVFLIESSKLDVPYFYVEPRNSLAKLGKIFTSSDWSHLDPTFDKNFSVTSANLNKLRTMLTFQFAEQVVKLDSYNVEGVGNYLALYKPLNKVDIIDMDNIYDSLLELCDIVVH